MPEIPYGYELTIGSVTMDCLYWDGEWKPITQEMLLFGPEDIKYLIKKKND